MRSGQRRRHITTETGSHANPIFDLAFVSLEDTMQALTISDISSANALPTIGRPRVSTQQVETRTSFTFPDLHQRIADAVAPAITSTWFNHNIKAHFEKQRETTVMGKFACDNNACRKKRWSSMVVAIWIRGYPQSGYNAIVYSQRCGSCNRLGGLTLDEESYVERIAYWLKRWAGIRVVQPPISTRLGRGPHKSEHCEGCKAGHCSRADEF